MSMFSRQHYQAIAEELKQAEEVVLLLPKEKQQAAKETVALLTNNFIKRFKADNPRFDEYRFIAAAKPE